MVSHLTTQLTEAAAATFPKSSGTSNPRPRVPWWNEACATAVRDRRRTYNTWRRCPCPNHQVAYRRLDAIRKRVVFHAQRTSWASHCSSLSFRSCPARTHSFILSMAGRSPPTSLPLRDPDGSSLQPPAQANLLAAHYDTIHSVPGPVTPVILQPSSPPKGALMALSSPFTLAELTCTIGSLTCGKAMGPDDIPNDFLTHLSTSALPALLTLFNSSWLNGTFPSAWKLATLVPIPKPGKDPTLPSSYRPISLLSSLGKSI